MTFAFLIDYYLEGAMQFSLWQMPVLMKKNLLICSDGLLHLDEVPLEELSYRFIFAPFDRTQKKILFKVTSFIHSKDGKLDSDNVPKRSSGEASQTT